MNHKNISKKSSKKSILVQIAKWIAAAILLFFPALFILNLLFPLQVNVPYSQIVTDKKGNIIHAYLSHDDKWRMMTELDEITPQLQKAIIFKEDKYFYQHFGINPIAISRALFKNITKQKRTSGASTITMQVARLLAPKNRTYSNKINEMFRALQLEWYYSKDEILQLYLNLVPYGGNIEGVKSASVLFFDKAPNNLSLAEITALSIIPNRPTSLRLGKHNTAILTERNKWLNRFKTAQIFDDTAISDALEEALNAKRKDAPKMAPHFSYRMKQKYPNSPIIKTNLLLNKQRKVEQLVGNYIKRLYSQRIRNAAVMVINNRTHEVEAYVGSADFFNSEDAGQVDGIKAIRAPGSTLKPFLYALAFDQGLITPKFIISDVPVNYSGYSPVNYDKKYNGNVSIEHALANSLNVPPVKILQKLGSDVFVEQLVNIGFKRIKKDRQQLGLSVILGGCGVRLEELTLLYSSFANEGYLHSFQWLQSDSINTQQTQILSPSAAFVVTDILTQLTRPDLPTNYESSKYLPKIAWKTGTSYGRRDAWSIGYNANYTIGVWVGNFSGEGVPVLNGADTATPLLFDIFNSVDYASPSEWFISPKELEFRWVCSASGLPPSEACKNQVMDYYLPLVSPTKTCKHLKKTYVSPDDQHSYCTSCLPPVGYKTKYFPVYSPEIVALYEKERIHYEKIPPHNPRCERLFTGDVPRIISPVDGLEYIIDKADNDQLMLTCNVANDVDKVFWYINDQFYQAAGTSDNLFFSPKKGKNKITCVDDKGRKKNIFVVVKFL